MIKTSTARRFSMRAKLRDDRVEVVVMDLHNDDVYALSWQFIEGSVSGKKPNPALKEAKAKSHDGEEHVEVSLEEDSKNE